MVLKTVDLIKKYGQVTAVKKVNMTINEGEIYGLLGPNGAGKTSLIKMICDMISIDEGQIFIFDKDLKKNKQEIKAQIGVVPQDLAIYEDLTAIENVRFFASLYGLKKQELKDKVNEALEFVGLTEFKNKKAKTFSGGMKRRLNIACAISHTPKLIIMDEPTVGIDPQSRYHILNSVKKLNERGCTIIYTTHLMEEAEFLCTRIGIIDHGKIIAEGTAEALESLVTDKKTISIETGLVESFNTDMILSIKGVEKVSYENQQLEIECLRESDAIGDIISRLTTSGVLIKDIEMKGANLENTFLSLTGRSLRDS